MNMHELRGAITDTYDEHWHLVQDGPFFHDRVEDDTVQAHRKRAVLHSDINIAIEWGMAVDDDADAALDDYDWASHARLSDPKVHEIWVDVFYQGDLVDRVTLLDVDGHRAYLPVPEHIGGTWVTRSWGRVLGRLVTDLSERWGSGDRYDDYLAKLSMDHSTY